MVLIFMEPFNSILYGFGAFVVSFIVLAILWSMFVKFAESFFSKSKLHFIPHVLGEVNTSILFTFFMISIYFGVMFYDALLLQSALMKIWGVVLIIVITEIIVKMLLNILDYYYVKSKRKPTFLSNAIPLMKRVAGVLLYVIAIILIINYLSSEVGTIVAAICLILIILLFVLYYEQLRNIMAGLHMINSYIEEGDYIEMAGHKGFVEKILEQHVVVRDLDGMTITIPNNYFVKEILKNNFFSEGNLVSINVRLSTKNPERALKRLSVVCSSSMLDSIETTKDYKPKVSVSGIEEGLLIFNVKFMVKPNSDLRNVIDLLVVNIKKEFKDEVKYITKF